MQPILVVIAVLVTLVVTAGVTVVIMNQVNQKRADSKVSQAEDKARSIIDDAVKTAEAKKRESMLEIKEE